MNDESINELELILRIITFQIEHKNKLGIEELDEILRVLSNRTRRRMLAELASGEGFVNDLVERLNDHPQSIIRHLEVLKKNNLIVGEERRGTGKGRPRLYYTLFPEVAEFISNQRRSAADSSYICSSFPRLNALKKRLDGRISHTEQRKIISEVENIKKEHEVALKVCNEVLDQVKKRVKKIPIK